MHCFPEQDEIFKILTSLVSVLLLIMKHSIAFLSIFLICLFCSAQRSGSLQAIQPKPNALSLELGKNGLVFNLVYEHLLSSKKIGFQAGVGTNFSSKITEVAAGGGAFYLVGKNKHFLELGLELHHLSILEKSDDQKGAVLIFPNYDVKGLYSTANIGYRVYSKKGMFRTGFSPGIVKSIFIAGGYVSYGITF